MFLRKLFKVFTIWSCLWYSFFKFQLILFPNIFDISFEYSLFKESSIKLKIYGLFNSEPEINAAILGEIALIDGEILPPDGKGYIYFKIK